ncbi:sodium:calcium symporter [Cerasicoccus frondis]|uniref:sodium:calcium symporter n=1 Tax=Cerasicoccus frondis TaxID=490090 RepID=UPI002852931B|nr:sodium:calcium symporter [Cerasicoccus frondis]
MASSTNTEKEQWNSRLGVILAVAGSAVGLGNFLRFPGQVAQNGGGAFMIAYFISFLLIGLPICWAEWTMGRHGGQKGFNSSPGIFNAIWRSPISKYVGIIGVIIPVVIYMYYVYIEAWCLGYAVNFALGNMEFTTIDESKAWWGSFIGIENDGQAFQGFGVSHVGPYLFFVFILNFILIFRGISGGIEFFCKIAVPTLVVIAVIVLIRVMTLTTDVTAPEENVNNGLGFLWNPVKTFVVETDVASGDSTRREIVDKGFKAKYASLDGQTVDGVKYEVDKVGVIEQLRHPELWLAAAGQIFFSLSVGFGVIITYSSYMRKNDDVVLSGLSATSANEFCEVALGGLITIPAAVAFIGVAGLAGAGLGTFDLGFKVLPLVFSEMPIGNAFGALWFFLLFLAAMTSSISMLQPGIAFIEETMRADRKRSCAILGIITAIGCGFVVYFSAGIKALDTLDFWVGTFLIFVLATIQIILFGWVFGIDRGFTEAHEGAAIRIPKIYRFIMKYVSPLFLIIIFVCFILTNVFGISFTGGEPDLSGYVTDLIGGDGKTVNLAAWLSLGLVAILFAFFAVLVSSVRRYEAVHKNWKEEA